MHCTVWGSGVGTNPMSLRCSRMDPLEGLVATQGDHFACLLARSKVESFCWLEGRREGRVEEDKRKVITMFWFCNRTNLKNLGISSELSVKKLQKPLLIASLLLNYTSFSLNKSGILVPFFMGLPNVILISFQVDLISLEYFLKSELL